jgi:hypothetical protein
MEKLTAKQRGSAAEHYVIAMLGFNGIPAAKMPDGWPGYDLAAQLPGDVLPLRISVKFRIDSDYQPYCRYAPHDQFDFIALVYKRPNEIRTWILPRRVADATSGGQKDGMRFWSLRMLETRCAAYENNFGLAEGDAITSAARA